MPVPKSVIPVPKSYLLVSDTLPASRGVGWFVLPNLGTTRSSGEERDLRTLSYLGDPSHGMPSNQVLLAEQWPFERFALAW